MATRYRRARGKEMVYAKLNGHDTIKPVLSCKKPAKWFNVEHDVSDLVPHNKGLQRPRIAYARRIARARHDNFYDGINGLIFVFQINKIINFGNYFG